MMNRSNALLRLGLAVLTLAFSLTPLAAQVPVGPEIVVDSAAEGIFPAAHGLAADGSSVVTWRREGTLYARLFRPNGQPRGAAIRITRPIGFGSALSVNPDGSFLVVWPKDEAVVGWRFDRNGRAIGRVFNINAVAAGPNNFPTIGRAPDGTFVVAWDRQVALPSSGDEAPVDIFVRRFAADGRPLSGEVNVTQLREEQSQPRLAVDARGRFALVYSHYTGEGTFYDVEARRLGINGAPRGSAIYVNSDVGEEELQQIDPAIAMAADGSFTIVWAGGRPIAPGGSADISGRQFTAAGIPRGPVFSIAVAGTRILSDPAIGMQPDGRFLALWSRRRGDFTPDGRLEGRRFTADGLPEGPVFLIDRSSSAGLSLESEVALNAQGGGMALWRRFDLATRKNTILMRRLAPAAP